jgi:hypothetical protein
MTLYLPSRVKELSPADDCLRLCHRVRLLLLLIAPQMVCVTLYATSSAGTYSFMYIWMGKRMGTEAARNPCRGQGVEERMAFQAQRCQRRRIGSQAEEHAAGWEYTQLKDLETAMEVGW